MILNAALSRGWFGWRLVKQFIQYLACQECNDREQSSQSGQDHACRGVTEYDKEYACYNSYQRNRMARNQVNPSSL